MQGTIVLPPDGLSDGEVVNRILAGEKKLFEWIVRKYNQRLFRIGMSVLHNETEVEDAMQTTYIRAFEHLGGFEQRSSAGTWLVRILLNECVAQKKRRQKTDTREHIEEMETGPHTQTPSNILLNKELSKVLVGALEQLPEKYRLVFVLREIEEMSTRETGEALGIEEPNVKVRLNRAKTMLRENLNGYLKESAWPFHLSRCDLMVERVFKGISALP